jgi:hypothetical protein
MNAACHLRRLRLLPDVGVRSSIHERVACLTVVVWLRRICCIHMLRALPCVRAAQKHTQEGVLLRRGIGHFVSCARPLGDGAWENGHGALPDRLGDDPGSHSRADRTATWAVS